MATARNPALFTRAGHHGLEGVGVQHQRLVVEHGELALTEATGLRACLRGAVPVVENGVRERRGELFTAAGGQGRAPGPDRDQARRVVHAGLRLVLVDQRTGDGVADDREDLHLVLGDETPDLGVVGARPRRRQHVRAARHQPREHRPLRRAVHEGRQWEEHEAAGDALGHLVGRLDRVGAAVVTTTEAGVEGVLLAPDHSLGHAGRAARVDDVEVVRAALDLDAFGRRVVENLLVVVIDDDGGLERRDAVAHGIDPRRELGVVHEGLEIRVVEQIAQLVLDVAVVHVDGDGAQLVGRQHRFDVLRAVVHVAADVVAGADATFGQGVREPVGAIFELGVRQRARRRDQCGALGHTIDGSLGEVSEVEGEAHCPFLLHGDGVHRRTASASER